MKSVKSLNQTCREKSEYLSLVKRLQCHVLTMCSACVWVLTVCSNVWGTSRVQRTCSWSARVLSVVPVARARSTFSRVPERRDRFAWCRQFRRPTVLSCLWVCVSVSVLSVCLCLCCLCVFCACGRSFSPKLHGVIYVQYVCSYYSVIHLWKFRQFAEKTFTLVNRINFSEFNHPLICYDGITSTFILHIYLICLWQRPGNDFEVGVGIVFWGPR